MSKGKNIGCYYCMLFTACIVFIVCVAPLLDYSIYDKNTCNITRIEYPTALPTEDNTNGWSKCDCGKRCQAWTTCIKMYTLIKPDLVIQSNYDRYEECTFIDDECNDGEDLRYATGKLSEVPGIVEEYNKNNEVTCYYDERISRIFLEKSYNIYQVVVPSIFLGIMLIIGLVYYYQLNYNNNGNDNHIKEKDNDKIISFGV